MTTPTREAMAQAVDRARMSIEAEWGGEDGDSPHLIAAAAELRNICATCLHWLKRRNIDGVLFGACAKEGGPMRMPLDGSGHCSYHEPKDKPAA